MYCVPARAASTHRNRVAEVVAAEESHAGRERHREIAGEKGALFFPFQLFQERRMRDFRLVRRGRLRLVTRGDPWDEFSAS